MIQDGPQSVGLVMALVLHINLVAIGIWDTYCYYTGHPAWTVTAVVQSWSHDFPLLVLLIGIVLGHLFFPTGR